jgi:uncharacterized protein YfaS (alpha-2-macroglobulin family)
MRIFAAVLSLSLLMAGTAAVAQDPPKVSAFSPQGEIKNVRQVRATFSEPMAPFGDPRASIDPFAIECSESGRGRWVDPRNWVYDFERDLPAGVRCSFQLKAGLRSLAGKELGGPSTFVFSTGGPAIRRSIPYAGQKGISEDQVFILVLDAAADEATVAARAGFAVAGIQQRIGARIVTGAEREAILDAHRWLFQDGTERGKVLLLQCRQRFAQNTKVNLIWGRGVASASGVATGQDQVIHFETRDKFSAEFSCERENARAGCMPVLPMSLRLNAPLGVEPAGEAVLKGPGGKTWRMPFDPAKNTVTFEGPFPANAELRLEIPAGLRDDAGRPLSNAHRFPLKIRTSGYPPLAKFAARFGIVERHADPALPVTLRRIEPRPKTRTSEAQRPDPALTAQATGRILAVPPGRIEDVQPWLRRVAAAGRTASVFPAGTAAREFKLPKLQGAELAEVVGIPLPEPGLYVVEIESAILGKALLDPPGPMFVPAAVLVTNLAVHFKHGRESSLAWVTTLDRAEPVAGAAVSVMNCAGKLLWSGKTDADGVARIDAELPREAPEAECRIEPPEHDDAQLGALRGLGAGLFVAARTHDDMSFVHSSWDEGIEAWRFKLPAEEGPGPAIAHTVFDRSLLRAGETVHMKHILRRHTREGFAIPAAGTLPKAVAVRHVGSGQAYEMPLAWDSAGVAETEWNIPRDAKLGSYTVALVPKSGPAGAAPAGAAEEPERGDGETEPGRDLASGRFRVEEFRVPLLKGVIQPPSEPLVGVGAVPLDLSVHYLSGGGAGFMPVRLRTELGAKPIAAMEGFDEFVFGNGPVREGLTRRGESEETGEGPPGGDRPSKRAVMDLVLDASGAARAVVPDLPAAELPQELTAELEFRDPNGEVQTVASRIPLWNADRLVGIKPDGWAVFKDALRLQAAVVDLSGRPVAGAPVRIDLFERKVTSHRKRLVGGFYGYDHTVEVKRVATLAEGRTDARGLMHCQAPSPLSGEVILVAESRDGAGRRTFAHRSVWVAGAKDWWFDVADHDRMDLLPERRRYEPGETAVFQVRMPFREATALVSVEREGILETWVCRISGHEPVIQVPVQGRHAPNVFVSVLAVRGRTGGVQPTALADLGKPAYRLGIAELRVGWREHELKVAVSTDRSVYKTREKVRVSVRARTADGKAPPEGSEIALAAVDEGLLELAANPSWELLAAMMGRRGYEVRNATAQMQVVGKRHYGIKALPGGGGGGRQATRELFDTLLAWQARLPLDERGEAEVEVPLSDALSAFRIVAVASGGKGYFGTGSTTVRSTQDLMLFSGLPPLVREGDRFRAGVTVRNSSSKALTVNVTAHAPGLGLAAAPQMLAMAAGEARELYWDVEAPRGISELAWEIEAAARDAGPQDRLRVVQKVVPAVAPRVVQAGLVQLEGRLALPVERPADALSGGGLRVGVRPRLGEGLKGVADYMRRYPYGCMEQKLSAAVALRDAALWQRHVAQLPAHMDADGLVKYFATLPAGDPVLTAYLVAVSHAAGWTIPGDLLARMTDGLKRFVEGRLTRPSPVLAADLTVRKLAALAALGRVGAVEPALVETLAVEPNLWPTSAVIDWVDILLSQPALPNRRQRLAEAEQVLRARLTYQGTRLAFSTEGTDRLAWLMVSGDLNAVRLVLTALRLDGWGPDLPQLVRGALGRQRDGHWDLTTANAWGVLAMQRFSEQYETGDISGATHIDLAGQSRIAEWGSPLMADSLLLGWPDGTAELVVEHHGTGKPWLTVQGLAALPLREPLSGGYAIRRTITAMERKDADRWSRGDILRVRLEIDCQADMTWVAVNDPVPAGASILGTGLGRDSQLSSSDEERRQRVRPAFEERSFEAFRAYYEYVPKGTMAVEYTLRLNQTGRFSLPPTRVEALYAPEVFGEIPNEKLEVYP